MEVDSEISVVIPIYNNQNTLIELNRRIIRHLCNYDFEIIFVNDSSQDQSLDVLKQLSAEYQQVKFVDLDINMGQQKATLEGLKRSKGQKVVVLDGDLQDAPELILELKQLITDREDAAYVLRVGTYQSKSRMITSKLIKGLVYLLSGLHYRAGSYYLINRDTLQQVIRIATNCKHPYLSIIVAHFSGNIKYLPANRIKTIGTSGYSFIGRIKAAYRAIYCSLYCSYIKSKLS